MAYKFNPFTGQFDDSPGLVTSTAPGLAPAGAGGVPGGSPGSIQIHNGEVNPGLDAVTGFEWDSVNDRLDIPGDINLDDGGAFTTTLQCITPTANQTISLPNATGTVALVAGSSGQLTYNLSGAQQGLPTSSVDSSGNMTFSGRWINSRNSAADAPAKTLTGTWFTGGTSTTTKPHFLIEPEGTTSTAWSTAGTGLGVNAPSGFTGNLLDLQVNGFPRIQFPSSSQTFFTGKSSLSSVLSFSSDNNGVRIVSTELLYLYAKTSALGIVINATGRLSFPNLPTYADNTAATSGGLVAGDVYKTATGELRITV